MFKWLESRILWGSLLILGGILFLLQNLDIIEIGGLFWAILLSLGGLFFISVFLQNRLNWWALIPGVILISVAVVVGLGYLSPALGNMLGGSIVLAGVGLSFLLIYLLHREFWWAIIPCGVLFSLAATVFVAENITGQEQAAGGIFLLGLGATFACVGLAHVQGARMKWPWIPAGILALIGAILVATSGAAMDYFMPLLLIAGGFALIYFALRPRRQEKV